jgi:hypothetical protein
MKAWNPTEARLESKNYEWQLVTDAFLTWKLVSDAKRQANKARQKERYDRLSKLSTKAWQRYLRRRALARNDSS